MDRNLLLALRLLDWPNDEMEDRPTYWQIAKHLDIPYKVIKKKIEKLYTVGVLSGTNIVPDVSLFDLTRTAVYISADKEVIYKIQSCFSSLDSIMYFHRFGFSSDSAIIEIVHYDDEHLATQLSLLSKVSGPFIVHQMHNYTCNSKYELDTKDLLIMKALMSDPMMSKNKIHSLTGLGERAIDRRIHNMAYNRAIKIEHVINSYNSSSPLFCIASITYNGNYKEEIKEKAMDILRDNYVFVKDNFYGTLLILFAVENFQEMNNIYLQLKQEMKRGEVTLVHPFESKYLFPRIIKEKINSTLRSGKLLAK